MTPGAATSGGALGVEALHRVDEQARELTEQCTVLLNLLGHYHSHGKRFTAAIKRVSGVSEKVFEMYDYLDPATFDYNSVTMNPAFSDAAAGAVSGVLNVQDGDILQWECHIINDSNAPLSYTNEVQTGEMCNIWGYSIGIEPIQCNIF